ncbi:MAG: DUF4261 domain-containing protein [Peptococcaceae bacterium]|jgi:hypothetical protein|nr:DUF4261 domain-containing protein [Peptococcaceae bacterium]MDR2736875.1 DUF4261 domain-containing protein [Gracilibacteraceae bacterium]
MAQKDRSGFIEVLMVELLYRNKPAINHSVLNQKMLQFAAGSANQMQGWEAANDENTFIYFHTDQVATFDNKTPQTCIMPHPVEISIDRYLDGLQQTWHWPHAENTVRECSYGLLVTDFMAYALPYKNRLSIFQSALRALLATVPCDAIYWNSSQKLIEPAQYHKALNHDEFLYGPVNIRLFNVDNPEQPPRPGLKEVVMDTCGLAALGLPDLQCHFYTASSPQVMEPHPDMLTPSNVRDFLLDMLYYVYDKGNIIEDGEICELVDQRAWQCEHQFSLIPPDRHVIDLNPGPPLYAGDQQHRYNFSR